ncbi:hypothetical protein Zmor_021868 [Zophobas morio]|uniref:Major facilitator superfamily (MFS) profile domain-containing protein n=1 Tax=Zophobas morio TaxID=2755281 RepID=A0AA38I779_9CUCU|nr:hypothetical protein Zmor_021868 [Zophobas morio]
MKKTQFLLQFLATFSALLSILSSGIHEAWTSVYIPKLLNGTDSIRVSSSEGSYITVSLGIGGLIGCVVAYFISDNFGRKKTILVTCIPFFVSSILLAYAKSVPIFCLSRLISGIASGMAFAVIPHYLGEIADPEIRGTLGTMVPIFNLIGFLFINTVGYYVSITTSSLITSVIPFILLLSFVWMPESPYYLIMIGQSDAAEKSLRQLKGKKDVSQELNDLNDTVLTQMKRKGKLSELFTKKSNQRALFMVFILLNGKQWTGIGPIDAYAQLIFQQMFETLSPLLITLVYYLTRFGMVIVSSFLVDKVGRRPVLIISFIGSAITLFLLALFLYIKSNTSIDTTNYGFLPIIFLEGFAIFYSFLTSVPLSILGELFPMNVKSFASIFYEVYLYGITLIVIKCFQVLSDNFGMESSFFIFAMSCLIHLVLVYKYVIETKGRSLEEIQKYLHSA